MNIVNGNPNIYFVFEDLVEDEKLVMELYPIIAFEVDSKYGYKIIALTLGEVEGTVFDCNLKCFIPSNGIKQTPSEYFKDYHDNGINIYMSNESKDFIGLSPKEEKLTEVTIVDKTGHNITSALGVEVYVGGGSLSVDN